MEKYKVSVSAPAKRDIREIHSYISQQLMESQIADRIFDALYAAVGSLVEMPHRFPIVTNERLATIGYRKLVSDNYIIFYTIDETAGIVYVERVLYSRRDWLSLL
jgi:plasmid stabilization system protein ParE